MKLWPQTFEEILDHHSTSWPVKQQHFVLVKEKTHSASSASVYHQPAAKTVNMPLLNKHHVIFV